MMSGELYLSWRNRIDAEAAETKDDAGVWPWSYLEESS